jgi:hypothetical protein
MAKTYNALVTYTDLTTMGVTPIGTPITGDQIATKAFIVSNYVVDLGYLSPFVDLQCPPYQYIISPRCFVPVGYVDEADLNASYNFEVCFDYYSCYVGDTTYCTIGSGGFTLGGDCWQPLNGYLAYYYQYPGGPKITASAACLNQTAPITVAYTATAGTRLVWYGTAATGGTATSTAPVFSAAAVGTTSFYAAQVDTAKGCVSDRVKVDVVVSAIPTAGTITRDADGYLVSSGKAGFKWYDAQNVLVDSVNAKFKPTTPGSYTMKYSENGCTSTASVAYYYLITDVINLSATEYIKLAPNPFVNYLNIDFVVKGYQKLNIDVFATSTGARVASKQGLFAGTRVSFAELSAGIYIFRVSSPDGKLSYQFKMVKL